MTKLEELTALLVNEINDFKNGIEKLEKINQHLKDTKVKMDLTKYKFIILSYKTTCFAGGHVLKAMPIFVL